MYAKDLLLQTKLILERINWVAFSALALLAGHVCLTGCSFTPAIYTMPPEDVEEVRSNLGTIGVTLSSYPGKYIKILPAKGVGGGIKRGFALFTDFAEVDSLQPTFRWQPFPRPEDIFREKVRNVTYEHCIWTANPDASSELRYVRKGLTVQYHTLEEPLEPSIKYLWSVRARFLVDGNTRLTEWGMAGLTLRNESVPNPSCFRFKTPHELGEDLYSGR